MAHAMRFSGLVPLCAGMFSSCSNVRAPSSADAPDPTKIVVYFPTDHLVYGRVAKDAVGASTEKLYVAAHPTGTVLTVPRDADGAFPFAIVANARDVIEIAAILDAEGTRGAAVFMEVPLQRSWPEDYVCCGQRPNLRGKCQPKSLTRCELSPSNPYECEFDSDCASLSRQSISIPSGTFRVTPPNARQEITITSDPGRLPPTALVHVENRGRPDEPATTRIQRTAAIANEDGALTIPWYAHGDEELVFRVYDLDGYRSREHAEYVPDSLLSGIDVIGAVAYEPLKNGQDGLIAVWLSPHGEDGFGLCPDSASDLALCFSGGQAASGRFGGGLDYGMVTLDPFSIDSKTATLSATNLGVAPTRFVDGDVRVASQMVAIIVDNSKAARTTDPTSCRMLAARTLVASLRQRDVAILYAVGGAKGFAALTNFTSDKNELREALLAISGNQGTVGPDIFGAVTSAAEAMQSRDRTGRGRVVVVTTTPPSGPVTDAGVAAYRRALAAVAPEVSVGGHEPYATHVVTLSATSDPGVPYANELESLAAFSSGDLLRVDAPEGFPSAIQETSGKISGAYVLLYKLSIPESSGKAAEIRFTANVTLPGLSGAPISKKSNPFRAILEIRDATTGQLSCQ